jgi:hypothetical protein
MSRSYHSRCGLCEQPGPASQSRQPAPPRQPQPEAASLPASHDAISDFKRSSWATLSLAVSVSLSASFCIARVLAPPHLTAESCGICVVLRLQAGSNRSVIWATASSNPSQTNVESLSFKLERV